MEPCKKCGKPLDENGKCECVNEDAPQEKQADANAGEIKNKEGLGTVVANVLGGFFSANPTKALNIAAETKKMLFVPLGIAHALLCGFMILLVPSALLSQVISLKGVVAYILPSGALIGTGIIFGALSIFVWAGLFKLIHLLYKSAESFVSILNVVSAALLPLTAGFAVSVVVSFFAPAVSIAVLVLASFLTTIMLYLALQKQLGTATGPIWLFTAAYFIAVLFVALFVTQVMLPVIINSIINNITLMVGQLISSLEVAAEQLGEEMIAEILNLDIFGFKLSELLVQLESITSLFTQGIN